MYLKTAQDIESVKRKGRNEEVPVYEHWVNAVSVRWTCTACCNNDEEQIQTGSISTCNVCRPEDVQVGAVWWKREMYWSMYDSERPIANFIEWILNAFDKKHTCLVYAHNGSRFDEHLILRELYLNNPERTPHDICMTGNKIYEMMIRQTDQHAKLLFRDTYLMMLAPLDKLKDIFDLKNVENKHYFPVKYNNIKKFFDSIFLT
ncbi:MAG TPA: DNA polymerase [Puia sp.]|nr:DNA polymerase [Puia sp.]